MNEAVEESRQSSACPAALIRHSWRLSKIRIVTGGSKVGMVESRSKQDRSTQQVSGDGLVERDWICKQGNLSKCSGQRAGEVDFSVPQIATEELRIALRLQTLVLPMWLQGFC